eukprot:CAMPEP_0171137736 /NCGR_PEP_ID=MMETSP0766_2-20121228/133842_1 /TAXON_ID=439317 /ORGANISM="Gambierdiscus australes, Strain CAWD 149" /LENGTH=103 /DNA_ID=CAMNT_0011601325 /DNA_START=857 /DNA_END=1168 /DNA_ORIENTATION=-
MTNTTCLKQSATLPAWKQCSYGGRSTQPGASEMALARLWCCNCSAAYDQARSPRLCAVISPTLSTASSAIALINSGCLTVSAANADAVFVRPLVENSGALNTA